MKNFFLSASLKVIIFLSNEEALGKQRPFIHLQMLDSRGSDFFNFPSNYILGTFVLTSPATVTYCVLG